MGNWLPRDGVKESDRLLAPVLFQVGAQGLVEHFAWPAALRLALENQGLPEGLVDEKDHTIARLGDTALGLGLIGWLGSRHPPRVPDGGCPVYQPRLTSLVGRYVLMKDAWFMWRRSWNWTLRPDWTTSAKPRETSMTLGKPLTNHAW